MSKTKQTIAAFIARRLKLYSPCFYLSFYQQIETNYWSTWSTLFPSEREINGLTSGLTEITKKRIIETFKMSGSSKSRRRRYNTPSSDESDGSIDSAEQERRKDLRERDEFANRLQKKDEGKTRKLVESSEKKGYAEAAKRLKLESEDRQKVLPHLRIQSRRKYLEKRKDDKVAELEADIMDDEYLFDSSV